MGSTSIHPTKCKQLVGVLTSIWTIDGVGRRPILLWGSLFMTISHLVIAVLVGRFSSDWPAHRSAGWVGVAFVSLVEYGRLPL